MAGKKLPLAFYRETDPVGRARAFLGKRLVVLSPEGRTAGIIVETEAYGGAEDKACHGYGNRRTARTEGLFSAGGISYVYFCYGLHSMINCVTGSADIPMGILIRGVVVTEGKDLVARRRPGVPAARWSDGPGKVAAAFGLTRADNGLPLTGARSTRLWIEETGLKPSDRAVAVGPRIGVDYAGEEWANKPRRFLWKPALDRIIFSP